MSSRDTEPSTIEIADDVNPLYGQCLRERREAAELSQIELGQLARVHRGTIRNAERGKALELRTHSNLLRALGCAPDVENWRDRQSPTLRPIFSAKIAGRVAKALMFAPPLDSRADVDQYFELVSDLSKNHLSAEGQLFCEGLVTLMNQDDAETFDAEVTGHAKELHPVRWSGNVRRFGPEKALPEFLIEGLSRESDLAQLALAGLSQGIPQNVITSIISAKVSDADRERLIRHAAKRSADLQLILAREIDLVIEMVTSSGQEASAT